MTILVTDVLSVWGTCNINVWASHDHNIIIQLYYNLENYIEIKLNKCLDFNTQMINNFVTFLYKYCIEKRYYFLFLTD